MGDVIYVDFNQKIVIHNEESAKQYIKIIEGVLSPEDLEELYDACLYESVYIELDPKLKTMVDKYLKILNAKPRSKLSMVKVRKKLKKKTPKKAVDK